MNRTKARQKAFSMVFELGFGHHSAEKIIEVSSLNDPNSVDDYSKSALLCIGRNLSDIDAFIEKYSVGWALSRMSMVSVAILRLAVYELMYMPDIPVSVSINEAVELAKRYEGEECASFINGILGTLEKNETIDKQADAE